MFGLVVKDLFWLSLVSRFLALQDCQSLTLAKSLLPFFFSSALPSRRPYAYHAARSQLTLAQQEQIDLVQRTQLRRYDDPIYPNACSCFRLVHSFGFCHSSYSHPNSTSSSFEQASPPGTLRSPGR